MKYSLRSIADSRKANMLSWESRISPSFTNRTRIIFIYHIHKTCKSITWFNPHNSICTRVQKPTSEYFLPWLRLTLLDCSTSDFRKNPYTSPTLHSLFFHTRYQNIRWNQYSGGIESNPWMPMSFCTIAGHLNSHTITSFLNSLRESACRCYVL